ncbi:hypothetical protein BRADI_1g58130v3 [Brachypodium distachyon]|uniref:Protein kinase domain-containing protein n=1 Tax=Brachypodium distachyon TaxID=15368 RepID=A0A0Q3HE00_BRADI|nr:hypothetical protein BRADI_1g58130v3 [Brachypodium distachyon]
MALTVGVLSILGTVAIAYFVYRCVKKNGLPAININTTGAVATPASSLYAVVPDLQIWDATVERFLKEIAGEKPIRFTPEQLSGFTNNYSARLGAGGFGTVYKGMLPNGLMVAVKRLHATSDHRTSQEQFMAEVGTIGRTHHINLVRLFGFCFDASATGMRTLVYEYMEHGALDAYLFDDRRCGIGFPELRAIAIGGLRYLHEECQQKIVHYDIKPGNVLLDGGLTPKAVSGMRGTPGYATPEMWMQAGTTEKCDVYSFGILLFEIIGQRWNFNEAVPESQQWFPKMAWIKYENGELMEILGEQDKETAERMCKAAFWRLESGISGASFNMPSTT